jgi:23S rRNA pseudouridine1911/1915/1917 synthase
VLTALKESSWREETRRLGLPIDEKAVGRRIDEYLAGKFPFFSRAVWQKEIFSGVVLVNGTRARKPAQRLQMGDELRRLHPFDEEPEVDTNMSILWCDGELAALAKPAGLPMHESGYYRRRTVAGVLPEVLGAGWTPVHRLDRETSGLLLCARQPAIRAKLTDMWTNKMVRKTYLAITNGEPAQDLWTVELPIKSERYERTNRSEICDDGDHAVTVFRMLSRGKGACLIEAKPLTGRTNQIRVHISALGYPLIGDKVYGADPTILDLYRKEGNSERVKTQAGYPRHALHAWRLSLEHPISRQEINLECPMPQDMRSLCEDRAISFECLEP